MLFLKKINRPPLTKNSKEGNMEEEKNKNPSNIKFRNYCKKEDKREKVKNTVPFTEISPSKTTTGNTIVVGRR